MIENGAGIPDIYKKYRASLQPLPLESGVHQFALSRADDATPKEEIRAVAFDIYGTLVISASGDISTGEDTGAAGETLKGLFGDHGIKQSPEDIKTLLNKAILDEHQKLKGRGIDYPEVDILRIWRGISAVRHLDMRNLELFAAAYEAIVNPVCPMPGLSSCLSAIKDRGIPMGMVSNAQFYTPFMFPAFLGKSLPQLGFHPDLMIFSYQTGQGKPSTSLYSTLAERLKTLQNPGHPFSTIHPKNCLYLGNDLLKDVWAASQRGFQTGLFAGDARSFRPRQDDCRCINLKADYLIDKLEDILLLLSRNPAPKS